MTEDATGHLEEVTVGAGEGGARLDRYLAQELAGLSRARLKALIEDGRVRVNGATISEPDYRVKQGQHLAVFVPQPESPVPQGQAIDLDVVYEDKDVIVVDKPAGLVVHPAPGNPDRTLVNALIAHCGDQLSGIGGVRRPGIVHRLDKDTSGLLVAAKNDTAHQSLAAQFAAHSIARSYVAVVWGVPRQGRGRIEGNIGRDRRNRKKMAVVTRGGKPAVTHYRVLRRLDDRAAVVACRLETGRTHQIRVHLAALGHPVVGDPLYGGTGRRWLDRLPEAARAVLSRFDRQALHAKNLGFRHPSSSGAIELESDLPTDIKELIRSLE